MLTGNARLVEFMLDQASVDVDVRDDADIEAKAITDDILRTQLCKTPHRRDTEGATALHYACMIASADIIRLLLERGANIYIEDERNRKAMEYFAINKSSGQALRAFSAFSNRARRKKFMKAGCEHFASVWGSLIPVDNFA